MGTIWVHTVSLTAFTHVLCPALLGLAGQWVLAFVSLWKSLALPLVPPLTFTSS